MNWKSQLSGICWPAASVLLINVLGAVQLLFGQTPTGGPQDAWMQAPPTSTGISVGQKIPSFSLPDQSGKARDFNSIKGPKGALIYFNRSVDW